jgi:conjugative transposon TraN protein
MKKIIFLTALCCLYISLTFSQSLNFSAFTDLPVIFLKKSVSVHLVSDQPVRYLNSSLSGVKLDQATEGLIRVSLADSASIAYGDGVLTLAGERGFAQFRLIYNHPFPDSVFRPTIRIGLKDWKPLGTQQKELGEQELKALAHDLIRSRKGIFQTRKSRYGIKARLNKIATLGNYIFIDLSFHNKSNIGFDIDQLSFSLEDKKIAKATNSQSVPIFPEVSLFDTGSFKRLYRNVFVFKKFTFPGNKILQVHLSEKQLSGRSISFPIRYSDVLDADVIVY